MTPSDNSLFINNGITVTFRLVSLYLRVNPLPSHPVSSRPDLSRAPPDVGTGDAFGRGHRGASDPRGSIGASSAHDGTGCRVGDADEVFIAPAARLGPGAAVGNA